MPATRMQFRIWNEVGFTRIAWRRQKLLKAWKGEGVTYWDTRRLLSAGLARKGVDGSIKLTDAGKWAAIACMLGMSMTEMYVMADMYVAYCARRERGAAGTYPIEWAKAKLGHILEPRTIYNMMYRLRKLGMIEGVSHGLYAITQAGISCLSRYHQDVHAMHAHVRQGL